MLAKALYLYGRTVQKQPFLLIRGQAPDPEGPFRYIRQLPVPQDFRTEGIQTGIFQVP